MSRGCQGIVRALSVVTASIVAQLALGIVPVEGSIDARGIGRLEETSLDATRFDWVARSIANF